MAGARGRTTATAAVDADRLSPYEKIKQAILDGDLVPGQSLSEMALAKWCEVSRTPIREALLRLEHDGLVMRSDRGLVVRERSPEEILDIYETRMVLEATAARVAAERRSKIDVLTLNRLVDKCARTPTDDEDAMVQANREFHRAVWRATHNESLVDLLVRLDLHLARYPATTLTKPGRWAKAVTEHRELVAAIDRQDAAGASAIATGHFSAARDIRLALWADPA